MDLGIKSRLVKTVSPAEVNPAVDSKKASINDLLIPIIKGNEPNIDIIIQLNEQRSMAVVRLIFIFFLFAKALNKKAVLIVNKIVK